MLAHFERLFGRSNRDVFLENEGKGCVKEVSSITFSFLFGFSSTSIHDSRDSRGRGWVSI